MSQWLVSLRSQSTPSAEEEIKPTQQQQQPLNENKCGICTLSNFHSKRSNKKCEHKPILCRHCCYVEQSKDPYFICKGHNIEKDKEAPIFLKTKIQQLRIKTYNLRQ
jgi:hypothetical protein